MFVYLVPLTFPLVMFATTEAAGLLSLRPMAVRTVLLEVPLLVILSLVAVATGMFLGLIPAIPKVAIWAAISI